MTIRIDLLIVAFAVFTVGYGTGVVHTVYWLKHRRPDSEVHTDGE